MTTPAAPAAFPFVVGCNRSGTTLLRAMLDSHPDLAVPPEAYFTAAVLRHDPNARFDAAVLLERVTADQSFAKWELPADALDALRAHPPATAADVVRGVYSAYARRHEKPRAGDKTPRNVLHIPTLAGALPESRFVHLVRDGRDVVSSVREHLMGPDRLPAAIDYWRDRVAAGRRAGSALGPQRYLEIRYEDLVVDPEATLHAVCRFVDLAYTDAMLAYTDRSDQVIAGTWDARNHAGVARPPVAGLRDWRTTMPRADVQLFDALAGDLLDDLGYGRSDLAASPTARVRAVAWRASRPFRRAVRPITNRVARRRRRNRRAQDAGAPPRRNAMSPSGSENSQPRSSA